MKVFAFLFLLFLLAGMLLVGSALAGRLPVPDRVKRFSTGMDRLLLIVPLLAVPVFAALFLFVLKGRLYERLCHAALVLALWLLAARFYWFLVSYFKHGWILLLSIPGLLGSAALAVCLTPLDRYAEVIHSALGTAAILPGSILLLVFYADAFFRLKKKGNRG
jgi:hypothetical protein